MTAEVTYPHIEKIEGDAARLEQVVHVGHVGTERLEALGGFRLDRQRREIAAEGLIDIARFERILLLCCHRPPFRYPVAVAAMGQNCEKRKADLRKSLFFP